MPPHFGEAATDPFDDKAIERGRLLFAQACTFLCGVASPDQFPETETIETAFAGRSNVGKSSLINALTGHNTLARTSNTPGRTRQINFFDLGGELILADLPGYGYARASKVDIATWTELVNIYLQGRPTLRRALLLIDARHGLKDPDREVMTMLDKAAVVYQIVLTKADKEKAGPLATRIGAVQKELAAHPAAFPDILTTSARTGAGIPELRATLAELAGP
jgi:GTP-binding protein